MKFSASKSCSGITLVEVIVAAAILAIGLVGIAAVMTQTIRSDRSTAARSKAQNYAAEEIEVITAKQKISFDTVKTEYHDTARVFLEDVEGFSGRVESIEGDAYLDLTVIVEWEENGRSEEYRITKRIYDRSGYDH
ncbi:MAG: type IV pilus modification PilV family protein [Planctomycetota bacterium]|jgi:type IV pilus assembly protein PilV